jgi:hypothetical protein
MDLTPKSARARETGFKLNQQASADGFNHGMGMAVYAQDQSFRDLCPWHSEDGIPAFSPEGSGKTRLRQVLCSIERHRHASCFRLNHAILCNREVADWTVYSDAKLTAQAPDLWETIRFRFHRSEHRSLAREYAPRGISKRFLHQLNTSKRDLIAGAPRTGARRHDGSEQAAPARQSWEVCCNTDTFCSPKSFPAGVPPGITGTGPVVAIPKALTLADIGVIELNEAFAVQALAVIRLAKLDPERVNPNGGAIALGHPLGCTGAKLTATILREMERRDAQFGMVAMCVGGGQGAAGIFERL